MYTSISSRIYRHTRRCTLDELMCWHRIHCPEIFPSSCLPHNVFGQDWLYKYTSHMAPPKILYVFPDSSNPVHQPLNWLAKIVVETGCFPQSLKIIDGIISNYEPRPLTFLVLSSSLRIIFPLFSAASLQLPPWKEISLVQFCNKMSITATHYCTVYVT